MPRSAAPASCGSRICVSCSTAPRRWAGSDRLRESGAPVAGLVSRYRQQHPGFAKPVLAVWVGAEQSTWSRLSDAGIPNYPTEDDAVRGFMYLVQHREVVEALAQVPPAMPVEFVPEIDAARQVVTMAIAEGREWLDPLAVKPPLEG